ncbi:MAG: phosphate ABC transporter permease PstA [Candidatus Dormiibacterota bacterium]
MNGIRRTFTDGFFWFVCAVALGCIVAPATWIIVGLIGNAGPALRPTLLTATTAHGGLQNAIIGTLLLAAGVLVIAGTTGIGAGIWLSEFASGRLSSLLRFFPEVLAGVPSIVIGYTGYLLLVIQFHWGYSILAAMLALSAIVTPYIVKTTEVALRQVPSTLREGGVALGLPMVVSLRRILLPPALPSIITGLVVAIAISTGETAPLLYTAGFSDQNPTPQLTQHPIGYLTYVAYTDIQLPSAQAHQLANAAAAVTLLFLLLLTLIGRLLSRHSSRMTARMGI